MATITITKITCIRNQDIRGDDEPFLKIAGRERWSGKMDKDQNKDEYPNESEQFTDDIEVELLERDGNKDKSLGSWTIDDTPVATKTLTATSSGYHYKVYVRVA